jgi:hypothetical protein
LQVKPIFHISYVESETSSQRKKNPSITRRYRILLDENCFEDISATLSATELRSLLSFIIWASLMHLILRILKSLEKTQKSIFFFDFFFAKKLHGSNVGKRCLLESSFFTFRIYEIFKGKYWFHSKNFEKIFLLKTCFLPIKSHKT